MKNKNAQKLGTLGGQKTAKLYGKDHFSAAGKLGMANRWKVKQPDAYGHLWTDKDVPTLDDDGEYGSYAKCSKCGTIENTDDSIKNCSKIKFMKDIKEGKVKGQDLDF